MGDTYAIHAMRRKRAHLAGEIQAAERALERQRKELATLDAVLRMFAPTSNPELIAPIQPRRGRNPFFRRGEQQRLILAALREGGKPMSCRQIADFVFAAKGIGDAPALALREMRERARLALYQLESRGLIRRIVSAPEVWWELAV